MGPLSRHLFNVDTSGQWSQPTSYIYFVLVVVALVHIEEEDNDEDEQEETPMLFLGGP